MLQALFQTDLQRGIMAATEAAVYALSRHTSDRAINVLKFLEELLK